jgi:hypothetical protein
LQSRKVLDFCQKQRRQSLQENPSTIDRHRAAYSLLRGFPLAEINEFQRDNSLGEACSRRGESIMNNRSAVARAVFERDEDGMVPSTLTNVSGGEPRGGQLTGTKALMLAVFEDGIRTYLGRAKLAARDAEYWIFSPRRHSPFSFPVVCETLGLDPDAVRNKVQHLKSVKASANHVLPRARHNVRVPGRVHARRSG